MFARESTPAGSSIFAREKSSANTTGYDLYPSLRGTAVCNRISAYKGYPAPVIGNPPNTTFRDVSPVSMAGWPTYSLDALKSQFLNDVDTLGYENAKIHFYTLSYRYHSDHDTIVHQFYGSCWHDFKEWVNADSRIVARFDEIFVSERWIPGYVTMMKEFAFKTGLQPASIAPEQPMTLSAELMPIPATHDLAAWSEYNGPYCRWMHDTGVAAIGNCGSNVVECTNPDCPISDTQNDGPRTYWKTRFCNPSNCRFFEW